MDSKIIYVVEDMAFTRAALIELLENSNYIVAGSAADAEEAWTDISEMNLDLVLLDINLAGEKDGIWLAKKIREKLQLPIVFLTAYGDDETLTKLNDIKPNGYLMKPYNKPTLITTINIALSTFENSTTTEQVATEPFIFVIESTKKVKLFLKDITYVVTDGNYLQIHLTKKTHIIRNQLSSLFLSLPKNDFIIQTHRRYLVNIHKIESVSLNSIIIDGVTIPISKTYKNEIKNLF